MTKLLHPKLGMTYKLIALRMVNNKIHRDDKGKIVRFRTQREAEAYASENFCRHHQPQITVLW